MNISLVITVAGPLVASVGWLLQSAWIYWFGVIVCVITMLLNMAVGAMRLPVLPIVRRCPELSCRFESVDMIIMRPF